MANKLYVGGLSWDTTDASLKDAFSQAGAVVSASVVTDRMSGRSRGFGFVEYGTDEEAAAAIEMWNGKELDGRAISVSEARPMGDRPARTGGSSFGGGSRGGNSQGRGGFSRDRGDRQW